jgi:hypothetical protein
MFGAAELADLCQGLEDEGASGTIPDLARRAEQVAARFEQFAQELQLQIASPA